MTGWLIFVKWFFKFVVFLFSRRVINIVTPINPETPWEVVAQKGCELFPSSRASTPAIPDTLKALLTARPIPEIMSTWPIPEITLKNKANFWKYYNITAIMKLWYLYEQDFHETLLVINWQQITLTEMIHYLYASFWVVRNASWYKVFYILMVTHNCL